MTADAFLDLCLNGDSILENIVTQLQRAEESEHFTDGPLKLHSDGRLLQLPISELAAALTALISKTEERLAHFVQSASLPDGGIPDTSRPGQGSEGRPGDELASSRPASFPSGHPSAAGAFNGTLDAARLEPGKLDLASFPSLGSTRRQVGLCCT